MISKIAQMAASSAVQKGLGACALGGFIALATNESIKTTQDIKGVFNKKSETLLEVAPDLSEKEITVLSNTVAQTASKSVKTEEQALTINGLEDNQASSKIGMSFLDTTWMKSLDWTTIAKVASVAVFALGVAGAAVMYVMTPKN